MIDSSAPQLQHIKDFIAVNYQPTLLYADADLRLTTNELFETLLQTFSVDGFSTEILYQWLQELNFIFVDAGNLRAEWLLKKQ